MAAPQPGVWGIDLGQCALKAIRLEQKDGQVVATAFDYIEHPKILSQPDADPDQLTREALEQFLSRNTLKGDTVVISVPGQSGLARFVKLPPVEEKKIADIVRFEAKQQIPFPLEEVVWDFQKLSSGSVTGEFVETEIGLFAMKRDMVNRALQQFKDVGVEVHVIQMAPLALCNYVAYDQLGKGVADAPADGEPAGEKQCVVALDIGTDNSNLVITDGAKIIWQRPIPLGGNHFTRALTKDLKLTFAKAEHLKRNAAKSPDLKKILASLKSVLNDFVGEVQRSLGYFTNTHRDAQIQYMVGLGNAFRLPGLQKFLQEKLGLEVRKMQKLERATGDAVTAAPTFTENVLSFAVAYGLALQGLKQTRLQTNLLPHEVRVERIIRGKKPWAVTAAACLVLALAGLAFAKSIEMNAVGGKDIDAGMNKVTAVTKDLAANAAKYDAEKKKVEEAIGVLNKIGGGIKERFNWQLLTEYVNMNLPLPNGERLTEMSMRNTPVKKVYWTDVPDAKKALDMLEARRFAQPGEEKSAVELKKEDEFIKKYLIQVNIEGIATLYSDDLLPYFKKIFADGELLRGMFEEEKQKVITAVKETDPEKAFQLIPKSGWVVEIRGYTYHWDNWKFVENTIIENLKYPDRLKTPDGKPVVLPKAMEDLVRKQIGFLFLYKIQEVRNPVAGKFQYIGQSYLPVLIKGQVAGAFGAGPGPMPMAPPMGPMADAKDAGAGAGAAPAKTRDTWRPIGELALGAGGGGLGGLGGLAGQEGAIMPVPPQAAPEVPMPMPMPNLVGPGVSRKGPASKIELQPRTEFVVLFVWREPISTEPAAGAAEEKKADDGKAPEEKKAEEKK